MPCENPQPQEVKENEYDTVPPRAPPHESSPLLRTTQATQQTEESTLGPDAPEQGSDLITPPPLPPPRAGANSSIPVYAETKACDSQNISLPSASDEVGYQEVKGYKSEEVCVHYTYHP